MGYSLGRAQKISFGVLFWGALQNLLNFLTAIGGLFLLCPVLCHGSQVRFSLNTGIPAQEVYVTGNIWRWDPKAMRMTEHAPGQYSAEIPSPGLRELQYQFVVDGKWMRDPDNAQQAPSGGYCNSLLITDFEEDPLLADAGHSSSYTETQMSVVDLSGKMRTIEVLHPVSPDPAKKTVMIYMQDGFWYRDQASLKNVLANLSRESGQPNMIAVLIPPRARGTEYVFSDAYSDLVVKTIVPAVEGQFRVSATNADRLVMGSSLGGLAAVYMALKHPDVFAQVASQSGSFWKDDGKIFQQFERYAQAHPEKSLKMYLEMGIFEKAGVTGSNERALALATELGIPVQLQRSPGDHDWIYWRNSVGSILRSVFQTSEGAKTSQAKSTSF